MTRRGTVLLVTALLGGVLAIVGATGASGLDGGQPPMVEGYGWTATEAFTVGDTIDGYQPPGKLDGLGAYEVDGRVRVLANHELGHSQGAPYTVNGSLELVGGRVSFFDFTPDRRLVDAGIAYQSIRNWAGDTSHEAGATFASFRSRGGSLVQPQGLGPLCSSGVHEAAQFGRGRGLADRIYFTGEESGGESNSVGGAEWALDPATGDLWHVPDLGRGAWENVTVLDTGHRDSVALLMADDTPPFDADGDGADEAAPLYLYVGTKTPGDFLDRNGLRGGTLYVYVADSGAASPADFNRRGTLRGHWVEIDNARNTALASPDGSTGYDTFGYPTQRLLWTRAEQLGAFGFSRPEDVATNPRRGNQAVLASTGREAAAQDLFGDADTVGTIYTVTTNFRSMSVSLRIIYDGDADPSRTLRSPDNLDWADDGRIYVQEDKAVEVDVAGNPLWGPGAVNQAEAGVVRMTSDGTRVTRIAAIDRDVVLDASISVPENAIDRRPDAGTWETSGILDVSRLFGERSGTLFILDVQAHGIQRQATGGPPSNAGSQIESNDLAEGGQLLFLERD